MITVTEAAAKQFIMAADLSKEPSPIIRLAILTKEDGAFDYRMGFDEAKEGDIRCGDHGVLVVVDPKYKDLIDEMTIDFVDMDGEMNFIFINPKDPNYSSAD